MERIARTRSRRKAKKCAELFTASHAGILYDRAIFDKYTTICFENNQFMIVQEYKKYLSIRYGKKEFTLDVPEQEKHFHIQMIKEK